MAEEQRHLEEFLNESQIQNVVTRSIGEDISWSLKKNEIKRMDGMPGYLGEHWKAVLYLDVQGEEKKVHLFLKRMPTSNKPKTEYIDGNNFFKREKLMYQILKEICDDGPCSWCVQAYIYTDYLLVMRDLSFEGYSTRPCIQNLDSKHIFVATSAFAQFHAAFVDYETKKSLNSKVPYRITQEFGDILAEPTFCDSPYLRACSKLSTNLLKSLSTKSYRNLENLEPILTKLYLDACDSVTEYDDTINVLNHRDLWVNNLMFKYQNNDPVECVLVDYQCLRYAPPTFDLMMFLYLTTDGHYRQEYEKDVLDYYYTIFLNNLSDESKRRVTDVGYDKDSFLGWCEKARMFGMFCAIAIQPFVLMDPDFALRTLHDPATYEKYMYDDRSEPVIAHALDCEAYRHKNLEVTEEFVETYVLKQFCNGLK